MASKIYFKMEESRGQGSVSRHPYNLRKCSGRVATPAKVSRRSRVKRGVCGDVKVSTARRKRIKIKPSAITHQEYVIPPLSTDDQGRDTSPTTVVIKTNPLFRHTSLSPPPQPGTPAHAPDGKGEAFRELSQQQQGFYGQRRKIRRTKEHEMISAVMDITRHTSEKKKDRTKEKKGFLEKLRNLGSGKVLSGRRGGYPLATRNTNTELDQILTQT